MVWPFLMGLAVSMAALSYWLGNGHFVRSALIILAGLVSIRFYDAFPISSDLLILLISATWIVAASAIPRVTATQSQFWRHILFIRSFLALNGLTGLWARVTDAPRVVGSLPYMSGDILLIAAMLLIGWSLRHEFIGRLSELSARGRGMVGNSAFRAGGSVVNKENRNTSNTSGAEYAREVMSNG
jgi:hypothetical protein